MLNYVRGRIGTLLLIWMKVFMSKSPTMTFLVITIHYPIYDKLSHIVGNPLNSPSNTYLIG